MNEIMGPEPDVPPQDEAAFFLDEAAHYDDAATPIDPEGYRDMAGKMRRAATALTQAQARIRELEGEVAQYKERLERVLNTRKLCTPEERAVLDACASIPADALREWLDTGYAYRGRVAKTELARRAAGKGGT